LKSAIAVLSKVQKGAFMQVTQTQVRNLLSQVPWDTTSFISEDDRAQITAFMQSKQKKDFFGAKNTMSESYAPASSAIFGILKNMYDQFQSNLSEAQGNELEAAKNFAALKEEKEGMLVTLKENLAMKTEQNRAANELNAKSKQLLDATREMLDTNRAFLADAEMKCQKLEQNKEKREAERKDEISAVTKAIEILRGGDTFTNTFNFLQLNAVKSMRRMTAKLFATAKRLHSPKLTEIAALMQTAEVSGAMQKVISAIVKMQEELKKDQTDEVAKRDYCVETKAQLEREKAQLDADIQNFEAERDELMGNIQGFDQKIAAMEIENEEIQKETEEAREVRTKENKEFQVEIADNLSSRDVLTKAMIVLKNHFEKGFLQQAPIRVISDEDYEAQKGMKKATKGMDAETKALEEKQAAMKSSEDAIGQAPGGFARYEASGGNKIIAMLEDIINETEELENQMKLDEKDAQEMFDQLESDNNKRIADNTKLIEENKASMADAQEQLQQAVDGLEAAASDREENERNYAAAKEECDWLLANFDKRQEARASEIAALDEAKGFLIGAAGGSFAGSEGAVAANKKATDDFDAARTA